MATAVDRKALIAERAAEQRDRIERLRKTAPPCSHCRYGPGGNGVGFCRHPIHWRLEVSPVTGKAPMTSMMRTTTARAERGLCGPEGELFEPFSTLMQRLRAYLGSSDGT